MSFLDKNGVATLWGNMKKYINDLKGVSNGIAPLDETGKVPADNLPEMSSNAGGLSYRIENAVFQSANWTMDETVGKYKYVYSNANITTETVVNVMFTMTSLTYANYAGVQQEVIEGNGNITLYSNIVPTADLVADILVYGAVSSESLTPDAQTSFSTQMSELGENVTVLLNNLNNTKYYYSLADVNATLTVESSMETVFSAMANNSILNCIIDGTNSVYPASKGILNIVKIDENNGTAQFQYEGKIATGTFTA